MLANNVFENVYTLCVSTMSNKIERHWFSNIRKLRWVLYKRVLYKNKNKLILYSSIEHVRIYENIFCNNFVGVDLDQSSFAMMAIFKLTSGRFIIYV